MSLANVLIAVIAGAAMAIALGAILATPLRNSAARALLGSLCGGIGGPLLVMLSLAGRAPRPPVAVAAGIDLGSLLGMAASGALCAVVAVLAVALTQRRARR